MGDANIIARDCGFEIVRDGNTVILEDLDRRMLSLKGGPDLAPFSDIEASIDTDPVDHSRGLMLLLVLRWPRGRARVFKTNSSPEAARVRGELQRLGVMGRA